MRYAIRHNDQPTGEVSMRLVIEAGSMQEGPGQEGIAHLLEHMAFRGSTHVPDGEVVKTLERLGLRFGADTNAQTGPLDTVYQFDLPQPDAESVDTGLHLMREIASELTLSQAALDGERKVVLAEARQRDTPDQHVGLAQLQAEFPGHPYARLPIGRTDVVENATPAQLRAFYDAYYRPERAVLVVVGDVDPKAMEAKIAALFSDWQGRGPPGGDPQPFAPGARGQTVVVDVQPGASISSLSLVWLTPYAPPDETRAGRIAEIVRSLANSALGLRIFELKQAAGHPFVAGGAALGLVSRRCARPEYRREGRRRSRRLRGSADQGPTAALGRRTHPGGARPRGCRRTRGLEQARGPTRRASRLPVSSPTKPRPARWI